MTSTLQIIPTILLEAYISSFDKFTKALFEALQDSESSIESFSFYTSVSAVFSSKTEGEEIELDSFIKHKRFGVKYQPDFTKKTDDLYNAYMLAQQNRLSEKNVAKAHALLTKHILQKKQQGKRRTGNMFVITKDGRIEYVAAAPDTVKPNMQQLFQDTKALLAAELSFEEVFYFASMLHLVFLKIHPFDDGIGRTARLLEKWFIAENLGVKAWFIQSEKYYYQQHQAYYNNIRSLGLEYEELDYSKALSFLQMLPASLNM